jgi:two-component system, cell cycle sensor histidine kinase and response regulator CckA
VKTKEPPLSQHSLSEPGGDAFRILFEHHPIPMWIYDAVSLRFLEVNDAAVKKYGFSRDEFLSMTIKDIRPPEDVERLMADLRQSRFNIEGPSEWRHKLKNGEVIHVEISSHTLEYKGCEAALVLATDITKRKHTEDQLRQLSRSVEQSPASIIITDTSGRIEYVNPKFTSVTGYTLDEVRGKNPRILKSGKTPRETYVQLWQAITAGNEWHGEINNKKKNGELYWEYASISAITNEAGTITHFLGVKEDITERKHLEQQLLQAQKLEGLGTLAGGIAHDFNNLLAMIMGSAELLRHHTAELPTLKKYVDRIIEAAERGSSISRQLLIFSRPGEAELKPISLSRTISDLREMLKHFLPKSISIHTSIKVDKGIILGDAGQIHQALLNLALNASDAMNGGGSLTIREFAPLPGLVVTRFPSAEASGYIAVSVSDTGTGMDEATIAKIYDPFFSTKGRGKGTGLGLTIVHGIVNNHHGFIDLESVPEEGTTFTLYFPLVPDEEQVKIIDETSPSMPQHATILLVDDEEPLRETLREFLSEEGYRVFTACNGKEALDFYTAEHPPIDLIITDLGMPVMGGEELFRRLRALNNGVSVVVTSGYLDGTTKEQLLNMGIRDVLSKPFKMDDIRRAMRAVLGNRSS